MKKTFIVDLNNNLISQVSNDDAKHLKNGERIILIAGLTKEGHYINPQNGYKISRNQKYSKFKYEDILNHKCAIPMNNKSDKHIFKISTF